MDDRELSFSKSEDEQSEMSNHDFEQDIKPVIKTLMSRRISFSSITIISLVESDIFLSL